MPHPCALTPDLPDCVELVEKVATCKTGFLQCLSTGDWGVIQQFPPSVEEYVLGGLFIVGFVYFLLWPNIFGQKW